MLRHIKREAPRSTGIRTLGKASLGKLTPYLSFLLTTSADSSIISRFLPFTTVRNSSWGSSLPWASQAKGHHLSDSFFLGVSKRACTVFSFEEFYRYSLWKNKIICWGGVKVQEILTISHSSRSLGYATLQRELDLPIFESVSADDLLIISDSFILKNTATQIHRMALMSQP